MCIHRLQGTSCPWSRLRESGGLRLVIHPRRDHRRTGLNDPFVTCPTKCVEDPRTGRTLVPGSNQKDLGP